MATVSPLAEFWYWQSDGTGGVVAFCAGCARRARVVRAQAADIAGGIARLPFEGGADSSRRTYRGEP